MLHHRAADYRRSRWKNGRGETLEVAIHPPSSTLDTFEWRISVALLEAEADFSDFPGIDRTLTIIDGEGIDLVVNGQLHRLDRSAAPLRFPGEQPARAVLLGGRSADLNVMTRRTVADHVVARLLPGDTIRGGGGHTAVFAENVLDVLVRNTPLRLAKWDLLSLSQDETASIVRGDALLVRIVSATPAMSS